MLGLACAVKWTGLSFFVLFAILSLVWDRAALKSAGVRRPGGSWARRSRAARARIAAGWPRSPRT